MSAGRHGRGGNPAWVDAHGTVYIEFLLAFVPVFILFLGIVQLSLIRAAKVVVFEAAAAGARSAAVILPDDPVRYDGAPVGQLRTPQAKPRDHDGHDGLSQRLEQLFGAPVAAPASLADFATTTDDHGPRLRAIEHAVHFRLAALAPSLKTLTRILADQPEATSVATAIGGEHLGRALLALLGYEDAVTAVTFPTTHDGDALYQDRIDPPPELVHVRILHLYQCTVPLVSWLMCAGLDALGIDPGVSEIAPRPEVDPRVHAALLAIPSRPGLRRLAASGRRFYPLMAEASFPYQAAPYPYPEPQP